MLYAAIGVVNTLNGSNEIIVIIEVMIFPLQIVVYKYIIKYKIITRLEVFICHKQCRD